MQLYLPPHPFPFGFTYHPLACFALLQVRKLHSTHCTSSLSPSFRRSFRGRYTGPVASGYPRQTSPTLPGCCWTRKLVGVGLSCRHLPSSSISHHSITIPLYPYCCDLPISTRSTHPLIITATLSCHFVTPPLCCTRYRLLGSAISFTSRGIQIRFCDTRQVSVLRSRLRWVVVN